MDTRTWTVAAAMALACWGASAAGPVGQPAGPASSGQDHLAAWITRTGDAAGKPFAIVDKQAARIQVFGGDGRLVGASNVLLGQTVGDHTVEGVGDRAMTGTVRPDERTTPAGRFVATAGRNLKGEEIVWLDYEAAFAIHRLRPGRGHADRLARLNSATPEDNRASLGCVVVPVDFYLRVVQPVLGRGGAVVYVLPEREDWRGVVGPQV